MDINCLQQNQWRFIDQTTLGPDFDAKQSFAIDDALCYSVGAGTSSSVARAWVHHKTISLGTQDTRLLHLNEGLQLLNAQGYRYIVRNSGGLAVVLDKGVLNLSLIFSEKEGRISIDEGFEAMVAFVKRMLTPYQLDIEDYEVVGSYCPGRYDLSVGGEKFAGISQRRLRHGVAVQIYICVTGSGRERARLIRDFYRAALKNEKTATTYPDIRPEVMASLSEITGKSITVQDISKTIPQVLGDFGTVTPSSLSPEETERYAIDFERMVDRNNKAF